MKNKYTAKWFINKFKKIPSSRWLTGSYGDGKGNHCVLGFTGAKNGSHAECIPSSLALINLFADYEMFPQYINDDCYIPIVSQESGHSWSYASQLFGCNPKERILTVLENIKGMQLTPSK